MPKRSTTPSATPERALCLTCFRPPEACVCGDVQAVHNKTGVTIMQHPRERHHPFGSARFAVLGLRNTKLFVCPPRQGPALLVQQALPPNTALLYPHPQAQELGTGAPPAHLLCLDATWSHAKKLYQANPWLAALPHVKLTPDTPSRYRIRREPHAMCLSTIEALVVALLRLEPDTPGLAELLTSFDRMIDRQICHQHTRTARIGRRRQRNGSPYPAALGERWRDLVVVYAEHAATGGAGDDTELVWLTAARPSTGETFGALCRASATWPNEAQLIHLGLSRQDLDHGMSPTELASAWQRFLRPTDVLCAWNPLSLAKLPAGTDSICDMGAAFLLKTVYCNRQRRGCGHLDDVLAKEGQAPMPTPFKGRAAERLGSAWRMALCLHRDALGEAGD
jgi:hypothetical protein